MLFRYLYLLAVDGWIRDMMFRRYHWRMSQHHYRRQLDLYCCCFAPWPKLLDPSSKINTRPNRFLVAAPTALFSIVITTSESVPVVK
jgi:hypothetical protein